MQGGNQSRSIVWILITFSYTYIKAALMYICILTLGKTTIFIFFIVIHLLLNYVVPLSSTKLFSIFRSFFSLSVPNTTVLFTTPTKFSYNNEYWLLCPHLPNVFPQNSDSYTFVQDVKKRGIDNGVLFLTPLFFLSFFSL